MGYGKTLKLLYSNYGITPVSRMPLMGITKLLIASFKIDFEERQWQQYLCDRALMTHETFVTYEDYKSKFFKVKMSLNKEQILEDAEKIKQADQGIVHIPLK